MDTIKDIRRRLAALSVREVEKGSASPAASLADCRALQIRLEQLKREALERIADLRSEVGERARERVKTRPSLSDGWRERQEGAKKLLADVQERVIGMIDGKQGDAIEAWTKVNEEIDARLARLEELEPRLARAAGDATVSRRKPARAAQAEDVDADDDLYAAAGATARPTAAGAEAEDGDARDDLYAAVGAEVRKSGQSDAYCPHCGRGIEPDDRYCRRCGHRLQRSKD